MRQQPKTMRYLRLMPLDCLPVWRTFFREQHKDPKRLLKFNTNLVRHPRVACLKILCKAVALFEMPSWCLQVEFQNCTSLLSLSNLCRTIIKSRSKKRPKLKAMWDPTCRCCPKKSRSSENAPKKQTTITSSLPWPLPSLSSLRVQVCDMLGMCT